MAKKARYFKITIYVLILIIIVAWGYYLKTGSDPTGVVKITRTQATELYNKVKQFVGGVEIEKAKKTSVSPTSTIAEGDWWQVYFTDPNNVNNPENIQGSIVEKLIHHINRAQKSIHIASFEFNLTPVAEALIDAKQKGVEVLWVTDDEHGLEADEEEDHGQFALLIKNGIKVKTDERRSLMHNKFWIFDGQVVWTGSTNITKNGIFRNNNNVIILHSPELALIFEREFQEMWNGEFGVSSPSTINEQQVNINNTPVEVMFAAEDDVIKRLVKLIDSAQNSIYFMAFSFTQDEMGRALEKKARAGLTIKGIFETRGSEVEYSELARLYRAKVPVRQDGNPRTFHHKVFVIDEKILVTGSFNFSNNASKRNDENVVIITHPQIATLYLEEFERRWVEAKEPDPKDLL